MGGKKYSSNDQRSNSLNPNNAAYKTSQDNRSNQLNPNNEEYTNKFLIFMKELLDYTHY